MLLSRFWYVVLAVVVGVLTFGMFLATGMYDRAMQHSMGEALAGDSQVVASFLRDDARKRTIALTVPALDEEIRNQLAKSNASPDKIPTESKEKVRVALRKEFNAIDPDQRFDALFVVDQAGRVVGQMGFDQASGIENFELGGFAVVADALHGWIRDDSWVLGGRIYRVVARPVENDVNQMPVGAIVGARILDDSFARELSKRTGAAVAFYAEGARVSSGAPDDFDTGRLDTLMADLKSVQKDPSYKDKGFSDVRTVQDDLGVVYARLVGEAWDLGAGYAVARIAHPLLKPWAFIQKADDKDKSSVPISIPILVFVVATAVGLVFSVFEHTRPLRRFRREAARFAKGEVDQLTPSRFRGMYREIASNINDGTDKVAAKGGVPRRAADLEQVLGPIPSQPAMSAFSLPGESPSSVAAVASDRASAPRTPATPAGPPVPPAPKAGPPTIRDSSSSPVSPPAAPSGGTPPPAPPVPKSAARSFSKPGPAAGRPPMSAPATLPEPGAPPERDELDDEDEDATVVSQMPAELMMGHGGFEDEAADWKHVYDDFIRIKQQCGEPTGVNFEKFLSTLRKNRDQLMQRHHCKRVKFSVYVKEGKAALKASPVKD
jgi:hypothetical protein